MEAQDSLLVALYPVLVAPYRLVNDPAGAFWLGTLVLAGWCLLLGETTLALARRLNREPLERHAREAKDYQARSLRALKAGDKTAYRAINRLASDAFGHSFFLGAALGMGALWPLFFAAAWLKLRFGALGAPRPGLDLALPWPRPWPPATWRSAWPGEGSKSTARPDRPRRPAPAVPLPIFSVDIRAIGD